MKLATRALPPLAYLEDKLSVHSRNILSKLTKRFRIILITTDPDVPPAAYEDVIRLPTKRYELQSAFQFARVTERLFQRQRIAFAYTYNCSGFALRKVPYVHVFGGVFLTNWLEYNRQTPWWRRGRWLPGLIHYVVPEAITAWRARIAVAKSELIKTELVRWYRIATESPVIQNGIAREYLDLYPSKNIGEPPTIVFTGRLHIDKGIVRFAEAFVKHREIPAVLKIIGDGPQRREIERLAAGDSRLHVLGWRGPEEIQKILSESQIFVFPGIIGGYSCSLLEGMASGHACICYDLVGNREAVGDAGFFEPVNDAEALCRRCAELCRNRTLRREYAQRAHERARTLTWGSFADKLADVFIAMYRRGGLEVREALEMEEAER